MKKGKADDPDELVIEQRIVLEDYGLGKTYWSNQ